MLFSANTLFLSLGHMVDALAHTTEACFVIIEATLTSLGIQTTVISEPVATLVCL